VEKPSAWGTRGVFASLFLPLLALVCDIFRAIRGTALPPSQYVFKGMAHCMQLWCYKIYVSSASRELVLFRALVQALSSHISIFILEATGFG
jgi:hypothetical protein